MTVIHYYKRKVFGRLEHVPCGPLADSIKQLTRRKTLTPEDAGALVALGVSLEETTPPPDALDPAFPPLTNGAAN